LRNGPGRGSARAPRSPAIEVRFTAIASTIAGQILRSDVKIAPLQGGATHRAASHLARSLARACSRRWPVFWKFALKYGKAPTTSKVAFPIE
jgi:hypothetical protein